MLAVITGGSSGIGAAFARKLAARGYDLLLVARREDRLRALADEIGSLHPVRAGFLAADLTKGEDCGRVAARLREASDLGLLVNNAGFGTLGHFWSAGVGPQEDMHRLHVLAVMRLTHAALESLTRAPRPATGIINVSSVAAFAPGPMSTSYHATKAWINAFTRALATELAVARLPIRVQALCPGFTLSEFHDVARMDRSKIPSWLWMTADFVVEESLRGFDRGRVIVIPGWRYRLISAFLRRAPESLLRRMAGTDAAMRGRPR